jgi:hypothetical protein
MVDRDKAAAWTGATSGAQQHFAAPHEEFHARLQRAWPSPEAERAVTDAYATYQSTLQEPWQSAELARRATDAYAECSRRVKDAFAAGAGDQVADAFRLYVHHLKKAWLATEPDAVTPQELGAVAQAMAWVAGVVIEIDAARSGSAAPRSEP